VEIWRRILNMSCNEKIKKEKNENIKKRGEKLKRSRRSM